MITVTKKKEQTLKQDIYNNKRFAYKYRHSIDDLALLLLVLSV